MWPGSWVAGQALRPSQATMLWMSLGVPACHRSWFLVSLCAARGCPEMIPPGWSSLSMEGRLVCQGQSG